MFSREASKRRRLEEMFPNLEQESEVKIVLNSSRKREDSGSVDVKGGIRNSMQPQKQKVDKLKTRILKMELPVRGSEAHRQFGEGEAQYHLLISTVFGRFDKKNVAFIMDEFMKAAEKSGGAERQSELYFPVERFKKALEKLGKE